MSCLQKTTKDAFKDAFYGAHQKNFNEDKPILSVAKCRPMIVVSRNIRYVRIIVGIPRRGASNIKVLA